LGHFDKIYSIELAPLLFRRSKQRFLNIPNLELIEGDSSEVLKSLLPKLKKEEPILFWLDAHYSNPTTAGDPSLEYEKHFSTLIKELKLIFKSELKCVILIDDMVPYVQDTIKPYVPAKTDWYKSIGRIINL